MKLCDFKESIIKDKAKLYTLLLMVIMTIIAIFVRKSFFENVSGDMTYYIFVWFEKIKNNGGFFALSERIGDYTPPYYYILAALTYLPFEPLHSVKFISCIFDFILAFYVGRIIYSVSGSYKKGTIGYVLTLMLPTVIINSSFWGQCDVIYVCFVIMSIYYLIKNKQIRAMIFYGIAFSFKLQAIFIAPFFLYMLLKGKLDIKKVWAGPAMLLAMMIPAVLLGDNIIRIFKIYIDQTGEYSSLNYNMANMYIFVRGKNAEGFANSCVFFSGGISLLILYYMLIKNFELNEKNILTGMCLFSLLLPFILPHMHERYYYMGVILTFIVSIINTKYLYLIIITELVSVPPMLHYLLGSNIENVEWNLMCYGIIFVIFMLFKNIFENCNKCIKEG